MMALTAEVKFRSKAASPSPEIVVANAGSPVRRQIEQGIQQGFARAYGAKIHSFLPLLVGIFDDGIKAGLGLRSATQPLMLSQYLSESPLTIIHKFDPHAQAHQVVEIGNLYSESHTYTLPLLMQTVASLHCVGVKYMIFTATQRLRQLFKQFGLPTLFIADAKACQLESAQDKWGSYYDTVPQVQVLAVGEVMNTIMHSDVLSARFYQQIQQFPVLLQAFKALTV